MLIKSCQNYLYQRFKIFSATFHIIKINLRDAQNVLGNNCQKSVWVIFFFFSRRVEIISETPARLSIQKQIRFFCFVLMNVSYLILRRSGQHWKSLLFLYQHLGSQGWNNLMSFHVIATKGAKLLFPRQAQQWFMRCFSTIQPAKPQFLPKRRSHWMKKAQW